MRLHTALLGPLVLVLSLFFVSPAQSAIIGIDAVHGFDEDARLTGSDFNFFRSSLAGLGHTLVNLNSFDDVSLAGVDVAILMTAYDNGPSYTSAQVSAINSFADTRAAFVSDSNLWSNFSVGADAHIFMGDNLRLLENIVNFLAAGGGALYIGEDGTGFQPENFNALVETYGISFSLTPQDSNGHTVTQFASHPITSGVDEVTVDFQLPIAISGPARDLTLLGGSDNILAVFESASVPASGTLGLIIIGVLSGLVIQCTPTRRKK